MDRTTRWQTIQAGTSKRHLPIAFGILWLSIHPALSMERGVSGSSQNSSPQGVSSSSVLEAPQSPVSEVHQAPLTADYVRMLDYLAQATQSPGTEIDLDFSRWIKSNSIGMTRENLTSFLYHYYSERKVTPLSSWKPEFQALRAAAEEQYFFDQDLIFIRRDFKTRRGGFKIVYRVSLIRDPLQKEYALARSFNSASEADREEYQVAVYEVGMIQALRKASGDPNASITGILPYEMVLHDAQRGRVLFLSPFYSLGNAYTYVINHSLSSSEQLSVAKELLIGLSFLHRNGFVHRDIKPGNILLKRESDGLHAVLADFGTTYQANQSGLEKMLDDEGYIRTTYQYLAPEMVEKFYLRSFRQSKEKRDLIWNRLKQKYFYPQFLPMKWNPEWSDFETDRASDLWSMGVALLEMVSQNQFSSLSWIHPSKLTKIVPEDFIPVNQHEVDQVLAKLLKSRSMRRLSPEVLSVLNCLLRVRPEERCSAEQAAEKVRAVPAMGTK